MRFIRETAIAAVLAFLLFAPSAFADGTNREGTVGYSGTDVGEVIHRLEKTTETFSKRLDDDVDQTILEDTDLEDKLGKWTEQLEDAFDEVRDEFEDGEAVRPDLSKALEIAAKINEQMLRYEFPLEMEGGWSNLRADLNTLVVAYGGTPLRVR